MININKDITQIVAYIYLMTLFGITLVMVFGVIEQEASDAFISSNTNSYIAGSSFYISNAEQDFGNASLSSIESLIKEDQYCRPNFIEESNIALKFIGISEIICSDPAGNVSKSVIYSHTEKIRGLHGLGSGVVE